MPSDTPGASGGAAEQQFDWDALARYLAGEGTAEERESVRVWLANHQKTATALQALDRAVAAALKPTATVGIDVERALARVNAERAKDGPSRVLTFDRKTRGARPASRWMPIAAAAAAVLAVGTLLVRG